MPDTNDQARKVESMTAFARSQGTAPGFQLAWELRSVNHRQLDVQLRMPESLRSMEFGLRETLAGRLQRGRVHCLLTLDQDADLPALTINRPLLVQLLATLEQIRRDAPETHPPTSLELLRWPGILRDPGRPDGPLTTAVGNLFAVALERLVQARRREGEALRDGLLARFDEIERLVASVQGLGEGLADQVRARIETRLTQLNAPAADERVAQEVALLAQKADLAEELERILIHLQDARSALADSGPHGRRLDFTCQELMREASTLAAKALLPAMAQLAVSLKVAIDQVREQAQNLE